MACAMDQIVVEKRAHRGGVVRGPRDVSPVYGRAVRRGGREGRKQVKHQLSFLGVLNLQHYLLNLQRGPRARTGRTAG